LELLRRSGAQNLNKRFPPDTQMQSLWLPAVRAQLPLGHKNPAAALTKLQPASDFIELGQIPFTTNTSCLYPIYVRAEAYLAMGKGNGCLQRFSATRRTKAD
jgi:hypothetical protein